VTPRSRMRARGSTCPGQLDVDTGSGLVQNRIWARGRAPWRSSPGVHPADSVMIFASRVPERQVPQDFSHERRVGARQQAAAEAGRGTRRLEVFVVSSCGTRPIFVARPLVRMMSWRRPSPVPTRRDHAADDVDEGGLARPSGRAGRRSHPCGYPGWCSAGPVRPGIPLVRFWIEMMAPWPVRP